ncbi:MAG: hypothetical protein ACRC68_17175, partial [Clostridium sp.]
MQKLLVLDEKQRLQSMYIALKGRYEGRELYLNVLNYDESNDNVKYKFRFKKDNKTEVNIYILITSGK